ncbi:UDP-N-acetylglucosamine transferase subunit ALG14 [Takifugu rubripes]|nr:UDP-N-acetylglucosamine transferase subunit ALG14 homolog [Takifugu rubripes]XP_056869779.1 UDP-N-acetylglucosamine transferase subunit ALG14 homolog [Takifugu flavidus]|eukprot:XP_003976567.1 PREDICTED: UDP-N-acetylglucosamine transferase subunit ALG14 homolog [Takifugu rubripes]
MALLVGLSALSFLLMLVSFRLYVVLKAGRNCPFRAKESFAVVIVAGSGGHTSEVLRLTGSLSSAFSPRYYVVADTDRMSEEKISTFENSRGESTSQFSICQIPRSREVHQSWSSSVVSTLKSFCSSLPLMFRIRPDMVLCNGPGTCVPLCVAALLLGILGIKKVVIVYVESVCRVHTLSLTGKILYSLSDYFFVQWPSLRDKYPKSIFLGRIV